MKTTNHDKDDDDDNNNNDTEMKHDDDTFSTKFIIKSMELIKWCFCAIFMLSWTSQSRMEIVDFQQGIVLKHMIQFFILLKHFIDRHPHNANIIKCMDNIRTIFLLLKKLCKTVPFPSNLYGGHNGAILLIVEILIYNVSLTQKLQSVVGSNTETETDEWEDVKDRLMDVYFHGISLLEFLNKQCDLVKHHLQRFQRSEYQLIYVCGHNRRVCRNLCFGFRKYYLRFCTKCGNELFSAFNENAIEENGVNIFIPDQVSSKEYMNYYFVALKKFCKQKELQQFDNDAIFNVIIAYLDYGVTVGDYLDFKDELGNWCLFRVKQIDERAQYQHRIQIGCDEYNKKWDQWIDSRSNRIDHPMTHTKRSAVTRDDML